MYSLIRKAVMPLYMAAAVTMVSCSGSSQNNDNQAADSIAVEDYHADNDIAMTVRSLIDAIRVGEPLDSIQYDFEGVLTDGSGRPLYTDIQGAPGVWQIEVDSPGSAIIRNIYLGDLLPADLEQYIVGALELPQSALVTQEQGEDRHTSYSYYKLSKGSLSFESHTGRTTSGLEGPLLTIRIEKS